MVTVFEHLSSCFIPLLLHALSKDIHSRNWTVHYQFIILMKNIHHMQWVASNMIRRCIASFKPYAQLFMCVALISRLSFCSGHLQIKGTCTSINNLFIISVIFVSLSVFLLPYLSVCTTNILIQGKNKIMTFFSLNMG